MFILSITNVFAAEANLYDLHNALYDYYCPKHELQDTRLIHVSTMQQEKIWQYINSNAQLLHLLNDFNAKIVSRNDKNIKPKLNMDDILNPRMTSNNPEATRILFEIRKLYLSMIYNDNFANVLAQITLDQNAIKSNNVALKSSLLEVNGHQIKHKEGKIDYLIVGSGPAGSLIAHQIRSKNADARIVILDAGSFVAPNTVDTSLNPAFIEMNNMRTSSSGGIILRNGEAIGGGTTVNIDLAFSPLLPSVKHRLSTWVAENYIPSKFIHKKANDWQILSKNYQYITDLLKTRKVSATEVNANNKILLNGIKSAKTYDLNQKANKSSILKNSAVDMLLLPALENSKDAGNLSILPNAKVKRINFAGEIGNRKAKSVTVTITQPVDKPYVIKDFNNLQLLRNTEYEIDAESIIISAGTLGSAGILLNSDINNDLIGKGITIHPSIGVVGEFDHIIDAHQGLSASVYAPALDINDGYYFESLGDVPSFVALIHPGSGSEIIRSIKNFRHLGGFGVMLIDTPNKDNKVLIDRNNHLSVDYKLSEADKRRFKLAIQQAVTILFDQGAKNVFIPSVELNIYSKSVVFTSKDQAIKAIEKLQFIENLNFITSAHMQGSNKIGANPKTSVVSHNFRVWDGNNKREIPNLYVVDSSVFPTSVGANPMQSIYTFAKIFVDQIIIGDHEFHD